MPAAADLALRASVADAADDTQFASPTAMDEATRQKRRKRHLSRVALSDPLQQEQGVKGLVDLALSSAAADGDGDGETFEALLQLLRPSGSESGGLPSLAVARAVCQGA